MPEGALDNVGFLIAAVIVTLGGLVGYAASLRNRLSASALRRQQLREIERQP